MDILEEEPPVTESQIDLITKPKEMQKQLHQDKIMSQKTTSKAISKKQAAHVSNPELQIDCNKQRKKELVIGEMVSKVTEWRRLYNGVLTPSGSLERCTLEQAASKVGHSKKSLDDYLLQIRFGKKYNFDFKKHNKDKVGVLRAFVRKMKVQDKELSANKHGKVSSMKEKTAK